VSDLPADALFEVMRSRFDVSVEMVRVGAGEFRVASVRQPEKLLDTISTTEFAVDERLPYWAELWTSAIVLAERVLNDQTMRGTKVLELGCGLGLVGLAAAKAGADVPVKVDLELKKYLEDRGEKKLKFKPSMEIKDPFGVQDRF